MLYFVVVVIYIVECQFTFDYIFCGRRLFSRPTWLAAQVRLVSTMLIGRAAIFPFLLPTFFVSLLFFLLQGQPRQEDGGGVNEDPGFRSVCQKALLVILVFIFNIILIDLFVKVVKRSFSLLVASRFPLNDAGRAIVATLAARILEDQQEPGFIRWTWPPIGMVGRLGINTKSCLFTS